MCLDRVGESQERGCMVILMYMHKGGCSEITLSYMSVSMAGNKTKAKHSYIKGQIPL